MNEYTVGINFETVISAEDEIDAISTFMDNLSWKDCYAIKIESQAESEDRQ